jgi:hypothetical protein
MWYFIVGYVFAGLVALASIVYLLGELIFWLSHYIRHQEKPRRIFWSILTKDLEKTHGRNHGCNQDEYYLAIALGSIFIGAIILFTWIVSIPTLLIVTGVKLARYLYGKKLKEKQSD